MYSEKLLFNRNLCLTNKQSKLIFFQKRYLNRILKKIKLFSFHAEIEIVVDYGVSSWESYLPKAKLCGWLLAVKSLCFSKLVSYFLSSSKSPEVVLYSQQIVGLTRLLGHPAGIWVHVKGFGWNKSLRPCNSYQGMISNGVVVGWCPMGLQICRGAWL